MNYSLTNPKPLKRAGVGWSGFVVVALAALCALWCAPPVQAEVAYYAPKEADFRPIYDADTVNKGKQTWDEYYDWVQKFYNGTNGFLSFSREPGWIKREKQLVQAITAPRVRDDLIRRMNALGRRIAAEWAKDNDVRKIDTITVKGWGDSLSRARNGDSGNGVNIQKKLDNIEADVEKRFTPPGGAGTAVEQR